MLGGGKKKLVGDDNAFGTVVCDVDVHKTDVELGFMQTACKLNASHGNSHWFGDIWELHLAQSNTR